MKKKLFIFIFTVVSFQNSNAQLIEDFENWNPYNIGLVFPTQMNEPVGWSCTDSFIVGIGRLVPSFNTYQAQLIKETPGHAGVSAMKLITKQQGALSIPAFFSLPAKAYPAIATNATFSLDLANFSFGQKGGTPISFSPSETTMYLKNNVMPGDSTFITAQLLRPGSIIDTIIATADTILSTNITSYTQISLPFLYLINNLTPTLVRYTISSGNPLAMLDTTGTFAVTAGTEIVVDDIEISGPMGIRQLINDRPIASVYPTTGGTVLYINLLEQNNNIEFDIYAPTGQLVKSKSLINNQNQISIGDLAIGSYIFSLKVDGVIHQTGKFVR